MFVLHSIALLSRLRGLGLDFASYLGNIACSQQVFFATLAISSISLDLNQETLTIVCRMAIFKGCMVSTYGSEDYYAWEVVEMEVKTKDIICRVRGLSNEGANPEKDITSKHVAEANIEEVIVVDCKKLRTTKPKFSS
jgi:hypothetical protein